MTVSDQRHRLAGTTLFTASCPACRAPIGAVARCPSCQFTGADTHRHFPGVPPPLEPVCDPCGLWDAQDLKGIAAARKPVARRYPQFRWCLCTVDLPVETNLSLYGFWLLNVAPLAADQTENDRLWTVLLVINPSAERVAAIPGYLAEPWLTDDRLDRALAAMLPTWRRGFHGRAVADFFIEIQKGLDITWRQHSAKKRPHE